MNMNVKALSRTFILRRAWLKGLCTRADIDRAFDTGRSPASASSLMRDAVLVHHEHLHWSKGRGVLPDTRAAHPPLASASEVLELLAQGAAPSVTGLFEEDARLLLPRPVRALTQSEPASNLVLKAVASDTPIRILYVGLRINEVPRWRAIWPCALEYTGGASGWRLHAQDLDAAAEGYPVKIFVLHRVMQAEELFGFKPSSDFVRRARLKTQVRLQAHLSDALTPEQAAAVRWGLGIDANGTMTHPAHSLYEFKRDWAGMPAPANVVWPVLSRLDELE